MSRQLFATIRVPAAVLAALLMAGVAWAQPRPPMPPPMRPPMPPAMRPPAPPMMGRPALPPGGRLGGFGRPTFTPPRANLLSRPNLGGSPALAGRRPGWAPPVAKRGWGRPAANLAGGRNTALRRGNTALVGRSTALGRGNAAHLTGLYHGLGAYGWHHRSAYGWGGYSSPSSSYPYSYNSYPSYSYDPNSYTYSSGDGSYVYQYSYPSSGDTGYSGSSYTSGSYSSGSGEEEATGSDRESAQAERRMELARQAFRKGDYAEAQRQCEETLRLLPGDANLEEFRALCQFAQGRNRDASTALHKVLAAGPGWDWNTLSSLYPGAGTYTKQLRALERAVKEYPEYAAGRFVLAYHYLALDERDAAADLLREVLELQRRDKVAATILEALEKTEDDRNPAPVPRPVPRPWPSK